MSAPPLTPMEATIQKASRGRVLRPKEPGKIRLSEVYWHDLQPWLAERGYMLRPRYRQDWKPSWKETGKRWQDAEDELESKRGDLLDATRVSDGSLVMLKALLRPVHPYEAEIGQYFSSEELAHDPRNHCVPVYDVLQHPKKPNEILLVMPYLRAFNNPPMETVRDVVDFVRQVFEGLLFMHEHHVAHRDCNGNNIMMDASMYPDSFHPIKTHLSRDFKGKAKSIPRGQACPKYYFVDFGIARKYTADQLPVVEDIINGGDRSPPEHQGDAEECDPFPTDVYYLGNMIRNDLLKHFKRLEFLEALVASMVQDEPTHRPTMSEVMANFEGICSGLQPSQLDSRLAPVDEMAAVAVVKDIHNVLRGFVRRALALIKSYY